MQYSIYCQRYGQKKNILNIHTLFFFKLLYNLKGKGKVFYDQEPPSGESTTTEWGVNYQLLAVMLLKQPNCELLVAVDHSQLRTIVSETIDSIDWPLQPYPCSSHWDMNMWPWVCQANAPLVWPLRVFNYQIFIGWVRPWVFTYSVYLVLLSSLIYYVVSNDNGALTATWSNKIEYGFNKSSTWKHFTVPCYCMK